MNDHTIKRHVLKTISYRLIATTTTVITAYCLGLSIQMSSLLGFGELMIKHVIYFFHERVWYNFIKVGRK